MEQLEDIISRLETIAEELNDYSMRILSDAIEAGETSRPPLEKQVSQARRAVEKALQHLGKN
jgi:exonuclease VII small subunit